MLWSWPMACLSALRTLRPQHARWRRSAGSTQGAPARCAAQQTCSIAHCAGARLQGMHPFTSS